VASSVSRKPATRNDPIAPRITAAPPLSLYIHIPWCVRKCPYCDFNSHPLHEPLPEWDYVLALRRDLETSLPLIWGRTVESIFFGGGTPSLLSARAVDAILTDVRTLTRVNPGAEITLEANPGTAEAGKLRDFRAAGVTRLSLGIQSFNPIHLRSLGRIHDDCEARSAVKVAQDHFERVNVDLMYGLPGQTKEEARTDVRSAIGFGVEHVSAYQLTLEPNTAFHSEPPPDLPDDARVADMQDAIESELAAAGFEHYETSAFARPGARCRHNLNYWQFGDYLGIGAGAHSKLTQSDRILRQVRQRHPRVYLREAAAGRPIQEEAAIEPAQIPFEFMMNALRLSEGIPTWLFAERTGLPLAVCLDALQKAEGRGLLEHDHARIRPTLLGGCYLNDLLQIFLP
jgi:putative oxygen-independent coproporphyrinogen III oxidase